MGGCREMLSIQSHEPLDTGNWALRFELEGCPRCHRRKGCVFSRLSNTIVHNALYLYCKYCDRHAKQALHLLYEDRRVNLLLLFKLSMERRHRKLEKM